MHKHFPRAHDEALQKTDAKIELATAKLKHALHRYEPPRKAKAIILAATTAKSIWGYLPLSNMAGCAVPPAVP